MKKLSDKKIEKIYVLSKFRGKSERAIAKVVGCSRSAVWYHLQKAKAI